jgi:hypothetical protein
MRASCWACRSAGSRSARGSVRLLDWS